MADLSLVAVDDIFKEIDKRFETVVILTIKERNGQDVFQFHKKGGHMTALGLCENYAFVLKSQKEIEEIDEFGQD